MLILRPGNECNRRLIYLAKGPPNRLNRYNTATIWAGLKKLVENPMSAVGAVILTFVLHLMT